MARILNPRLNASPNESLLQDHSPSTIRSVLAALGRWPRVFDRAVVRSKPTMANFGKGRKHPTGDLQGEILWTVCVCSLLSDQLTEFCKVRDHFSLALFDGKYVDAESALDQIESHHGVSMWLLETRLLFAQTTRGPRAQSDEFDRLRVQLRDGVSPLLLFLATRRIEFASTPLSYEAAVGDFLASVESDRHLSSFGRYVAFRTLPFTTASAETLIDVLWQESRFSAIDLYLALLEVLRFVIDARPIEMSAIVRTEVQSLARVIDDPRLRTIAAIITPGTELPADGHADALMTAADAYTEGRYVDVTTLTDMILAARPDCFDAVELWAKATINAGRIESFTPPPVDKVRLIDNMRASVLLALAPEYTAGRESVQALKKLAYTLLSLPQGRRMVALSATLSAEANRHSASVMTAVYASALTPRASDAIAEDAAACVLLDSIARRSGRGSSVEMFAAFRAFPVGTADIAAQTAPEQRLRYRARALLRSNCHEEALGAYEELEGLAKPWSTFADDALCGRFDCLVSMKQYSACARIVADAVLSDRPLPRSAQLNALAEAYERHADDCDRADVTWSIFFAIRGVVDPIARNVHAVFAAMDTFLLAQRVDRPSLLPPTAIERSELRTLFLKLAGTPEVLEYSIAFSSVDELEAERIAICQQLVGLDPDNADVYSSDIEKLVRRITVRSDLKSIDSGKVHVDLEGIRRTLDPALSVRIDYFVALAAGEAAGLDRTALRPAAERGNEQASVQLEAVGRVGPVLFKPIFDAMHRRYVSSNEFGLDSYLSLRIRHGVLVGHIRSVFEQAGLITRRNAAGAYQPNVAWDADLHRFGIPTEGTQTLLAEFSAKVDAILEETKSQRIQVRSDTHPDGLFDLAFSDDDLAALYRKATDCRTSEDLIDLLFTAMNARTVRALPAVRTYVTTELNRALSEALSELQSRLHAEHAYSRSSELSAAIPACRARVHAELATVSEWFVFRTDLEHSDFELGQPIEAVEEVVKKVNPSSTLDVRTNVDVPVLLRGGCFTHFVDILWLLLDNVAKHAAGVAKTADIAGRVDGDNLVLSVRNRVGQEGGVLDAEKIDTLRQRLRPGESPVTVRREGGSGFFKLKKILEHGLGLGDSFQCELECDGGSDDASREFAVTLWIPLSKVCLCRS